jgi:tetratricopeptide (TPR) repeat protein
MQRYDEALAQCNRDIEFAPGYAQAIASRSKTYGQMKRYGKALADLKRLLNLSPSDRPPGI